MSEPKPTFDASVVRARMEERKGPHFWRSLDELSDTEGFQEYLHREFPREAAVWEDSNSRRDVLRLMGASLALGGLAACTKQPPEKIIPYVNAPEEIIPGKPLFFATAATLSGVATGVLVESHMGRPTKIEGNPDHPASLGATDVITQASVLDLYDPDRQQTINFLGEIRSYNSFLAMFKEVAGAQDLKGGAGLRILTETVTSPALGAQIKQVLTAMPAAKWHQWEPLGAHAARAGAKMAFGQPVNTIYNFAKADVIVSLDADFLGVYPGGLKYAREFAAKRRVRGENTTMSRFYAAESTLTNTGAKADHRFPMKSAEIGLFAKRLAAALGAIEAGPDPKGAATAGFAAMVRDLEAHKGSSLVIPGQHQTAEVHALAHAINAALGNVGSTVTYTDSIEVEPVDQLASLKDLLTDIDSGSVEVLLILGGNPVFNAPLDLNFKERFQKAKLRIRLGAHNDETSEYCQWNIPESHYLEAWGDARAFDGTVTIIQPLIAPLYQGKSAHEILNAFGDNQEKSAYDSIREYWQKQHAGADFEAWWRKSVHDGLIAGSRLPAKPLAAKLGSVAVAEATGDLEVSFRPDDYLYDGRFANNAWLQELPRPITRLTWDNAAILSTATAKKLGVENEDRISLSKDGREVWASVWIIPGHPNDSILLSTGYGRTRSGRAGNGAGANAFLLRTSNAPTFASGITFKKLNEKFRLAAVQHHFLMEGRGMVQTAPVSEYIKNPSFARDALELPGKGMTIYPEEWKYEGYAWGMAIDLASCTGCNSCVVACQSENNIAVVGKRQVLNTREMHWIRIDRYHSGTGDETDLKTHFQPVACQHCELAPCEVVCPVAATVHDQDGLNNMVYNRCVGTRYCSNNCPYKVRRFNFMLYTDWNSESMKLQRNPDVTVRSRGVMEKCTYCIQRINSAKIYAERDDRKVQDGEIVTACEAACPSQAIIFGDLGDQKSRVSLAKREKLSYSLLADLNTRPRTSYLAEVRNPNPELMASVSAADNKSTEKAS